MLVKDGKRRDKKAATSVLEDIVEQHTVKSCKGHREG